VLLFTAIIPKNRAFRTVFFLSNPNPITKNLPFFQHPLDIARVSVGNPVSITFDALLSETFQGSIKSIESAETIIDGVVNFKIIIKINETDQTFRSGLTANLSIETSRRSGVLFLPEYAITEKDNGTFVEKMGNGIIEEIPVTAGARDSNGNIEIISGLIEGQEVVASGLRAAP